MTPDISYIVSCFNRPVILPACLWSLYAQSHGDFEVIVTDNSPNDKMAQRIRQIVLDMKDARFRYLRTAGKIEVSDCYWSAEYGMKRTTGRWLCFPCDDCYYPPEWGQRMLTTAYRQLLDLVLCESLVAGPEPCGSDRYMKIDLGTPGFPGYKPSFIIKREKFAGWINKPTVPGCSGVDRTTLQYLLANKGMRWGVARDLYYAHN